MFRKRVSDSVLMLAALGLAGCGGEIRAARDPKWEDPAQAKRGVEIYRVGDEWSRPEVTAEMARSLPTGEQTWLKRIARFPRGTGFLLGIEGGSGWLFTNRHVAPTDAHCTGVEAVQFVVSQVKARCKKRIQAWSEHDLALIQIEFDLAGPGELASLPWLRVPSSLKNTRGDWLATAGFGIAGHAASPPLTLNRDSDCRSFSNHERSVGDPPVLSFAHGCDTSSGDSGSPIWERETGQWMGVVWSGFVPKIDRVQKSLELLTWLTQAEDEPLAWETMNFGVYLPAARSSWELAIQNEETPEELAEVLRRLVDTSE